MGHFTGKVVWITGASSGIGRALALQLAEQKANLILTARHKKKLEELKTLCTELGADSEVLPADLSNEAVVKALVPQAMKMYGRVDVLINNAGVSQRSLAKDTQANVDRYLMELNFFSPVYLTKQLLPHFIEIGSGQVIAISSMAGLMGFPLRSAYAAAKHALHGFFETLQVEHTIPNFSVTIVSPGRINTGISAAALTGTAAPYGILDEGQQRGISAESCATQILKAASAKKKHVIIAKQERLLYWLWWYWPAAYHKIARRVGLKGSR